MKRFTTSKRLGLTIGILILNYITFWIGIYQAVDLIALGTGLAMINAPAFGYIFGETVRPSGKKTAQESEDPVV